MLTQADRCVRCNVLLHKVCTCGKIHGFPSAQDPRYCKFCINAMREEFVICRKRKPKNFQEARKHDLSECVACTQRKREVKATIGPLLAEFWPAAKQLKKDRIKRMVR